MDIRRIIRASDNTEFVVVRDSDATAVAILYQGNELEIACYRRGGAADAAAVTVHGGYL